MAKKRVSRPSEPSKPSATWEPEDTGVLIAWLDHSLEHGAIDFDKTIVWHLKQECQKEYSRTQIDRKLQRLRSRGTSDEYAANLGWRDVFHCGSKVLGLLDEEKTSLVLAKSRLEGKRTVTLLSPDRQRRSTSRLDKCPAAPPSSLEKRLRAYTPQDQKIGLVNEGSRPSSRTKRESEPIDLHTDADLSPTKKRKRNSQRKRRTPSKRKRETKPSTFTEDLNTAEPEVYDSEDEPQIVSEVVENEDTDEQVQGKDEIDQGVNEQSVQKTTDLPQEDDSYDSWSSSSVDDSDSEIGEIEDRSSLAGLTKGDHPQKSDEAMARIERLKEQVRHRDSEILQLQTQVTALNNRELAFLASEPRDLSRHEPIAALVEQKDKYMKHLTAQLYERRHLVTFTKSPNDFKPTTGSISIDQGFKSIFLEVQNILHRQQLQKPLIMPRLEAYDELQILLCDGLDLGSFADKEVKVHLSKFSLQGIVRLATTAALRKWVFEDDFPQFGKPTELLIKYRENLGKLDGATALRNLDLSAHHSIIGSADFQDNVIPKKTRKLAKRLLLTLAPFFVEGQNQTDKHGYQTWGHGRKEAGERKNRLLDMFSTALKLKADSILHPYDYEMIIYAPGTIFNKETMKVEDVQEMDVHTDCEGRVVEVCLQAAVFSYPKRSLGDDSANFIPEAIVSSRNFSRRDNHLTKGNLIVPAVVILREEQFPSHKHEEGANKEESTDQEEESSTKNTISPIKHMGRECSV